MNATDRSPAVHRRGYGLWQIGDVVPLLDLAHDLKQDLAVKQKVFLRCFKTHSRYYRCSKGARYICCVREPCAAAYSFFKLLELFQPGELSVEDFVGKYGCL